MNIEMKKDVIYRCIGSDFTNGILACGFMTKPTHDHSQYEFCIDYYSCFLLLSGSGHYYTDENQKMPIQAGDLIQRIPDVCHSTEITPDGTWLEFFISFGRSTYDYLCSLDLLPIDTPVITAGYDEITIQKLSHLLSKLKESEDKELPYLSLQAQELVLSLLSSKQKTSSKDSRIESLEEACRLLASDIDKLVSLETIASSLNMSYENFRKLFLKHTGLSPNRYRIEQRIKHAKLMLLSGISIKETALLTGYADTYSFTKQFTHTAGISPGRYVKESKLKT
ncbi:helix-turn-helix domain-containing protein [Anaerobium acetethylicum]|uniref:AraC-type DNA-binding protein n=1 Tax=Anaerobium acetethylicum TaxID=1619234 RepID=A0A1D3TPM0_9FIRM|nr:AraC family transcriptional regulator [Anaerobium acetethylicum]SCP95374.1 AraC-type DNA-binding protein [Anaerobium acetethylicum]